MSELKRGAVIKYTTQAYTRPLSPELPKRVGHKALVVDLKNDWTGQTNYLCKFDDGYETWLWDREVQDTGERKKMSRASFFFKNYNVAAMTAYLADRQQRIKATGFVLALGHRVGITVAIIRREDV